MTETSNIIHSKDKNTWAELTHHRQGLEFREHRNGNLLGLRYRPAGWTATVAFLNELMRGIDDAEKRESAGMNALKIWDAPACWYAASGAVAHAVLAGWADQKFNGPCECFTNYMLFFFLCFFFFSITFSSRYFVRPKKIKSLWDLKFIPKK